MEILATQGNDCYFDDQSRDTVSSTETRVERISREVFPDLSVKHLDSAWKKPIQYGGIQGCSGLLDMDLVGARFEGGFNIRFDGDGKVTAEAVVKVEGDTGVAVEGKITQEFTPDGMGPTEIDVNVKYDDDQKDDVSEQNRYHD